MGPDWQYPTAQDELIYLPGYANPAIVCNFEDVDIGIDKN